MTRSPKKSETIEIRLEHATKAALQAKAHAEGRSVSEIIRSLIARYLGVETPSSTWRSMMRYSVVASVVAVFAAGVFLIPSAHAHDVSLGVTARVRDMAALPDLSAPEARFDVNYGQPIVVSVPRSEPKRAFQAEAGGNCL